MKFWYDANCWEPTDRCRRPPVRAGRTMWITLSAIPLLRKYYCLHSHEVWFGFDIKQLRKCKESLFESFLIITIAIAKRGRMILISLKVRRWEQAIPTTWSSSKTKIRIVVKSICKSVWLYKIATNPYNFNIFDPDLDWQPWKLNLKEI